MLFLFLLIDNNHAGIGVDGYALDDVLVGNRVEGVVELDSPGLLNLDCGDTDDAPPIDRRLIILGNLRCM